MSGESVAPPGLDPEIHGWSRADGIDVLGSRLTYADVRRFGRVLGALAAAGLIDECYVFVCAVEDGAETAD